MQLRDARLVVVLQEAEVARIRARPEVVVVREVVVVAEVAVCPANPVEVEIPVVARIDTPDDGVPEVVIGIVDLRAGTGARDLAEQPGIRLQAAHELPDRLTESP